MVASCWLFLYNLYYDEEIHEHQILYIVATAHLYSVLHIVATAHLYSVLYIVATAHLYSVLYIVATAHLYSVLHIVATAHLYSVLHICATNFQLLHFMNPPLAMLVYKRLVRCEVWVLTAVLLRIQVFWDVMLCHWVSASWCFKGM